MQLRHFLSWNKANVKQSCKSQLYIQESIPIQTSLCSQFANYSKFLELNKNLYAILGKEIIEIAKKATPFSFSFLWENYDIQKSQLSVYERFKSKRIFKYTLNRVQKPN